MRRKGKTQLHGVRMPLRIQIPGKLSSTRQYEPKSDLHDSKKILQGKSVRKERSKTVSC